MSYAIFDIELTRPLPGLSLPAERTGLAVLARHAGVPVAFWLEQRGERTGVTAAELAREIASRAGVQLVARAVREELGAPAPARALPALTIAICTRDRPEGVARLLDSLAVLTKPEAGAGHVEILVVDNAPSDERTRALIDSRSEVRYVREPRPGLNFGRNRAVAEARGELLAFLDDDVVVDRHWLAGLAEAWNENPDAAAFTGLVLPLELETEAQILFERRGGFRRGFDKLRFGPELPGNPLYPGGAGIFGTGANMTFRTAALRELGGFDEALDTGAPVPGGGDLDIFYRVIRSGGPLVYEPRCLVFHLHRRELPGLRRQYRKSWGLGFMVYVSKCLRTDPERRGRLLGLIGWWFLHEAWQLVRSAVGRHALPPSMIVGELAGGVVGLLGGYGRSLRRTERIRLEHP